MLAICKFTPAMILRFILFALGFYIIYKVVFDLVIPIFRTTQKIRRQFGDMQQHMQDQMNGQNPQNGYNNPGKPSDPQPNKSTKAGDYIDFEEIKS
jgi:hypothetical protein